MIYKFKLEVERFEHHLVDPSRTRASISLIETPILKIQKLVAIMETEDGREIFERRRAVKGYEESEICYEGVTVGTYPGFEVGVSDKGLYLNRLYINPEFQGQGIGKKVTELLTSFARENGMVRITLRPDPNTGAKSYWIRRGFKPHPLNLEMELEL